MNYVRCPIQVSQRSNRLRAKITDLFMADMNDNNNWYKSKKAVVSHFENTIFILCFFNVNF